MRNPTKAEKRAYKEKMQHGQGLDLEPKSHDEIKSDKSKNIISKEYDEEARLSGSKLEQYFKDQNKLGSPPNHDDFSDESFP